jgi:hypothetical protein
MNALEMWETAGKAGIITANLMWCVVLVSHQTRPFTTVLQAWTSENNIRRIFDILRSVEGKFSTVLIVFAFNISFSGQSSFTGEARSARALDRPAV